jgi:hypothetical protein
VPFKGLIIQRCGRPYAISVSIALLEVSSINTSIYPCILAESLGKSIYEFSFVLIPVKIILDSLSMLEPVFEMPEVKVTYFIKALPFVF